MAEPKVGVRYERLRRINVPVPNPGLAEWLMGAESRRVVEEVTTEIFNAYYNTLPVITGNLRRGAYMYVDVDTWGPGGSPRWFGYVGNKALSYRPRRGYLYGRFIEYGKPTRGIPGQHQLARAAELVAGDIGRRGGINIPGVAREPRGRGSKLRGAGGRFIEDQLARDQDDLI